VGRGPGACGVRASGSSTMPLVTIWSPRTCRRLSAADSGWQRRLPIVAAYWPVSGARRQRPSMPDRRQFRICTAEVSGSNPLRSTSLFTLVCRDFVISPSPRKRPQKPLCKPSANERSGRERHFLVLGGTRWQSGRAHRSCSGRLEAGSGAEPGASLDHTGIGRRRHFGWEGDRIGNCPLRSPRCQPVSQSCAAPTW
jgi:hypothetical protein